MAACPNSKSQSSGAAALAALVLLAGRFVQAADEPSLGKPNPHGEASQADSLRIGSLRVGKILFLGNSITLHGPKADIGWLGNWGMAASSAEKDYVHLLVDKISQQVKSRPQVMVKNIADFERQLDKYDLDGGLKQELAFEPDLVIVAIGENAAALNSDAAKEQFRAAFAHLLSELKAHGQPVVLVRSSFWADPPKDVIMQQAARDAGAVFVDIQTLGKQPGNAASSERKIEHAGVAGHPGDKGMQAIADALWSAIERRAADQP